jgi:outer membrane protein
LNYTFFFDEETRGALAGDKLTLDSSFGPAAQLGIDVDITSVWFVNADVRWIDIDTKAKLKSASGTVDVGKVRIDPLTIGVSIGRRL